MEKDLLFINDSWHYIKRTVNLNNLSISYTQEGGFISQRDAAEAIPNMLTVVAKSQKSKKYDAFRIGYF